MGLDKRNGMTPRHDPACATVYEQEWDCTCGLEAMRAVVMAVGDAIHTEPMLAHTTRPELEPIVEAHRDWMEVRGYA